MCVSVGGEDTPGRAVVRRVSRLVGLDVSLRDRALEGLLFRSRGR